MLPYQVDKTTYRGVNFDEMRAGFRDILSSIPILGLPRDYKANPRVWK